MPRRPLECNSLRALAAVLALAVPTPALAHGSLPSSESIGFGPGAGEMLFGTLFGALLIAPDGAQRFLCETAVTGYPQSLGSIIRLDGGEVLAIVAPGGFARGIFASDASACRYAVVPSSDTYRMADLVADPRDARAFYATGADETQVALFHGQLDGVRAVYRDPALPVASANGLAAVGDQVYAVFSRIGRATLVHSDAGLVTTTEHPLTSGSLHLLGVSPASPRTVWFTHSTGTGDALLRSDDAGATLVPVLEQAARLRGFAQIGNTIWVQSAQFGVMRSDDGGHAFEPLPGSPRGHCLGVGPDDRLYACGVLWLDGFALGVSEDGRTFTPTVASFDHIEGAIACPSAPETTTTCNDELDFLRTFYGFATPVTPDPDTAPEPEPRPEAAPESAESDVLANEPRPSCDHCDEGCSNGTANPFALLAVLIALRSAVRSRPWNQGA